MEGIKEFGVSKEKDSIPDSLRDVNSINNFISHIYKDSPKPNLALITNYMSSKAGDLTFSFRETNDSEVTNILMAVSSKAYGDDGINSVMLLMCCPFLISYITHILNSAISEAVFPRAWKKSLIVPIPKVKHPSSYDQLRFISILPAVSKILEKVMELQIREYVNRCSFLPEFQSGFRRGYGCCSALAKVTDDIFGEWDRDRLSVLILIDYSKAFDTLEYSTLVAILHHLGFDLKARLFISSFLSGRIQKVKVGGTVSEECAITSGVPQGSVLSPLLYTLYTSLLFKDLTYNKYHLYADDTQIYCSFSINNIQEANRNINLELEKLTDLSRSHGLNINPSKTTALLIGNSAHIMSVQNSIQITIAGKTIPLKTDAKNLGLVFDNNLRFRKHVNLMLKRSYCSLKLIYPNRHILDMGVKKMLCDSLVLSHFNHCDVVYDTCLDSFDKKRIQKVQNSCMRLIFGIRRRAHISHKLKELNWLNMQSRRTLHQRCFFFKIINSRTPPYLHRKISFRTDVHNVNVRRKDLLTVPKHSKELFKRSFSYNIVHCINSLDPGDMQMSYPLFRRKHFALLFDNQ